ncbi:MAG: site-specific integrase [Marinilabiliales bacterium]|nr:site-specific integrase [Marinilabiliales bacterium]
MKPPASSPEDALRLFLEYLTVEKGLARNTVQSYERDVRKLVARLKAGADASSPASPRTSWPASSAARARPASRPDPWPGSSPPCGPSSGSSSSAASSRRDPSARLTTPSTWLALPKFLTVEEVEALLQAPDATKAARRPGPGHARGPLRIGPAGLRAGRP